MSVPSSEENLPQWLRLVDEAIARRIAIAFAETVLPLAECEEADKAVAVAKAFMHGEATQEEMRLACIAARRAFGSVTRKGQSLARLCAADAASPTRGGSAAHAALTSAKMATTAAGVPFDPVAIARAAYQAPAKTASVVELR